MKFNLREPSVATAQSPSCRRGLLRIAAMAAAMLIVGCGQKGPLTLPAPASAASVPAAMK
jgi:predicted small lipoprotein YifL